MFRRIAFINPSLSTDNVGDLFIVDSVKRIVAYDKDASVDIDPRKPITQVQIDQINACNCALITGTNLWYRKLAKPGRWMFTIDDLKKIKVPIIPLGVGTTRHTGEDNGFDADTLAQLKRIHESCPVSGSARDIRTVEALQEAGIGNAVMTGCPTLFRSLSPAWKRNAKDSKRVVVTVRKGQRRNVRLLLRLLRERGLEPVIAAQQEGDRIFARTIPFLEPRVSMLYEYNIRPYIDLVEQSIGAIGWRLHGNMLHLAHGNPAINFSNCSRSASFCESFGLPLVQVEDGDVLPTDKLDEMIQRLTDPATFEVFPSRYAQYRQQMADFLEANSFEHRLAGSAVASRG